ncbi:phenylacetic acid degradation operon negative regulatory protein PaaX [candidate division WOR-3 bacterium]|nr:phenylacetic acid degradation operon negative regulatory protein PaaX [candidate division WOR-3 bacterium]
MAKTSTVIFTLFGGYINHRGGEVWVGSLIKLLKPFGLSENAIRLALSRMSKQELIQRSKIGRESYYSLTKKGNSWMLYGEHRALKKENKKWDKKWRLLTYNIPEKLRHLRDTLRKELRSMGYGSLGSSLWISPYDLKEKLEYLFDRFKVADYIETFEAIYTGLHEGLKLTAKAWDIMELEKRYKEFLKKYSPLLSEFKGKIEKKEVIDLGECFARRFRVTAEFIDIALDDPMLPLELLPVDWAGLKAREICFEYRKLLGQEAEKFVDMVFRDSKTISGKTRI